MANHGWFIVMKSSDGQFYFNLEAPNDEVIATSERYTTKQKALEGITSVKRWAPGATTIDVASQS
ncbi:hypothetical protein GCM10027058_08530 [Microbacterium neimengense]